MHKNVANSVKAIFGDILQQYGYDRIVELGIDLFGGSFAYRAMRNGSEWSKHAFGIAIDLDPLRNQRRTSTNGVYAPEYNAMIDIFINISCESWS